MTGSRLLVLLLSVSVMRSMTSNYRDCVLVVFIQILLVLVRSGSAFSPVLPLFIPSLVCEECQRPMAHECLGEVLRVMRQVISTYPLLNTVEILTAAGKLISKVKGQP